MTVVVIPSAMAISSGSAGGSIYPSTTYNGTIYRGDVDIYTFQGVAGTGHTAVFTMTRATGTHNTQIRVFTPSGADDGGNDGGSYTYTASTAAASGTYTVLVWRWQFADGTDTYTLSASGTGIALPTDANNDGDCSVCNASPLAASSGEVARDGRALEDFSLKKTV